MKKRYIVGSVIVLLLVALFALAAFATSAEIYFSSDKNGANRVTNVQEGDQVWICVYDPDQNIDCDLRDKMWPDIKLFDPKTGAYIVWNPVKNDLSSDYLEETGPDTGLFVSKRAFQIGTRYSLDLGNPRLFTHVVDVPVNGATDDFQWGHYMYVDNDNGDIWAGVNNTYPDNRVSFSGGGVGTDPATDFGFMNYMNATPVGPDANNIGTEQYLIGRFENMDTLVGMYQDPNDATDVAVGMMTIIIVNPGSWNPVQTDSPTNFCMLKRTGGVAGATAGILTKGDVGDEPIRWYNIYNADANAIWNNGGHGAEDGRYYIQYDVNAGFDTVDPDGVTAVSFYAQETGPSTGVFQLNLNDLRTDLGFNSLNVGDVLVAYYLDPNDEDDFHIATAYIESKDHISITSFTDATRAEKSEYWIGRDPVYVQVIDSNANVDPCCPEQVVVHICDVHEEDDSEWVIADETSSNSPVFFTNAGMQLLPVWDALGIGLANSTGGYQLQLDNWKLEVFNEDSVYARYNDVTYTTDSLTGLGDVNTDTAFPPAIESTRVANDISFAQMEIADTQVYDGSSVNMYFLDRQGNRVTGYVNSDCVFVEVVDPDQDEDQYRRERVDGYWDGGQNAPFGPLPFNEWGCDYARTQTHSVNALLGDTNIFNDEPVDGDSSPKLYVLNPRNGRWAAVDLLETGVATGDFVSVTCIDLTSQYSCVPTLGVKPGDTIVAVYQDPSNHSDSAWITIKVGMGGGGTPPSQASTTMFVDADGNEVTSYTDVDSVYVKVIDPSHAGATSLLDAVEINGTTFDLAPLAGASSDTFITDAISLSDIGAAAGDTITATYTDPTDPTDTSSDEITIVASALSVTDFYAAPNPFSDSVSFAYHGTGIATQFSVSVYDLAGHLVWSEELANVTSVEWDGTDSTGAALANGAYIYVVQASDGTNTFSGKGTVFIKR